MKIKLKKGEKLSSNQSYQGLDMEVWTALNQGKVVEIDSMPKICKSQLEEVKGSKQWLMQFFHQKILKHTLS